MVDGIDYFSCARDTGIFIPESWIERKLNRKELKGAKHLRGNSRPLLTKDDFKEWFRKPTRGGRSSRDDRPGSSRNRRDRRGGGGDYDDRDRRPTRGDRRDRSRSRGGSPRSGRNSRSPSRGGRR